MPTMRATTKTNPAVRERPDGVLVRSVTIEIPVPLYEEIVLRAKRNVRSFSSEVVATLQTSGS
jgi:hypothetical protein